MYSNMSSKLCYLQLCKLSYPAKRTYSSTSYMRSKRKHMYAFKKIKDLWWRFVHRTDNFFCQLLEYSSIFYVQNSSRTTQRCSFGCSMRYSRFFYYQTFTLSAALLCFSTIVYPGASSSSRHLHHAQFFPQ